MSFLEEARALGYDIELRAPGFSRPDLGVSMPSVYAVTGFGSSMLLRDDDLDVWRALVSPEQHQARLKWITHGPIEVPPPSSPSVIGPIAGAIPGDPSRNYPQMATNLDLPAAGYVEEEYFFEGRAAGFATPELKDGYGLSMGHRYRTRMLVRRPADPAEFSGTALVEWLNVSAAANVDQLWLEVGGHLLARGIAYVGVSAQRLGVHAAETGLRDWCPERYGSLDLTDGGAVLDDSLCYEVYSQAALAIRGHSSVKPLGPLVPRRVLAYGGSQSAMRLRLYYNSVHPQARIFDGFALALAAGAMRPDLETPAFRIWSETELLREAAASRQPDSAALRTWEVAGSSHLSYRMASAREALVARGDVADNPWEIAARPPLSRVPWGHALVAGFEHLVRWADGGEPPPSAPQIEVRPGDGGRIEAIRDARGNALGGLRLSQHEVAVACNRGLNEGPGWALLWGSHEPFDAATLRALYPTRSAYVDRVRAVDTRNLDRGYLTEDAAAENLIAAETEWLGG